MAASISMRTCGNFRLGNFLCLFSTIATLGVPSIATNGSSSSSSNVHGSVDRWDISHPLDEGLWSDHEDTERECLEVEENVHIDKKFKGLRNDLRRAEIDSLRLFSKPPLPTDAMKPMEYTIFKHGRSALRDIAKADRHLMMPESLFGLSRKSDCRPSHYRTCAVLLLLRGYSDAAHEMLLGVTWDNQKEAVYAATHRGQTSWSKLHPLSDSADILHAAIHRIVEGNHLGEGNHTGYDNAKYWLAGGPKLLDTPSPHPIREALAKIAQEHTPMCLEAGVIAKDSAQHTVLSGGGKTRVVRVPCGQWDDYVFLDLCRRWEEGSLIENDLEDEVATLQRAEIILLLRNELRICLGRQQTTSTSLL